MILFLHGPDDYRRHNRKRELISEFQKKYSGLGLGVFDGESDGALESLVEFLRNESIFDIAKFAVIENAFEVDPSRLAKNLEPALASKTTTVLISEKEKPVKALAFLLKAPVRAEQFESLEGVEWNAFIKAEAKQSGLALTDSAAQFLGAVYQGNSWAAMTELQKLAGLKAATVADSASVAGSASAAAADAEPVDKKDLDALDLEVAPNYWMLLNGLKSQDGRTRLATLERLFALGDPAPKIFNILAAQAGEKTVRMAEYDVAVKSGKVDYEEALLDLVLG